MMSIVIITLVVSVSICLALFTLAFLDVVLGRRRVGGRGKAWFPPVLRGRGLSAWVAETAQSLAHRWLSRRRSREKVSSLLMELHEGTSVAINQTPQRRPVQQRSDCQAYSRSMIAVTPPEAIAIADAIRSAGSLSLLRAVRVRAAKNVAQLTDRPRPGAVVSDVVCPLLGEDNTCVVFGCRPLRCRGWCALIEQHAESGSTGTGEVIDRECLLTDQMPRAHVVVAGAESGLRRGLAEAGLDDTLYELNSALVTAIQSPDVAEQWLGGHRAFEDCTIYA